MTPNMVTVIGAFTQLIGILLVGFYDLSLGKEVPCFIYIFFAFLVFFGQTMDAIDGKHARNTKRSSPLGQLMDHGCDAFSNSFIIIMVAQSVLLGSSIYTILIQTQVQLLFYASQWEEHYTGVLKTHYGNIGVTEFQFIGMSVILLPVIGHDLARFTLFKGFMDLKEMLILVCSIL